ncbi:MAG: hypothetical protein H7328_06260 [Bdellovibrio sp.]|nr:hypothetical protein [Bdellovibrio sp.]
MIQKISFAELNALALGSIVPTNLRINMMSTVSKTKWVSVSGLVQCFETTQGCETPGCDHFQNPRFAFIN